MGKRSLIQNTEFQDCYKELVNRAPIRIQIVDPQGILLYANAFDTNAGKPALKLGLSIFERILPRHRAAVRSIFEDAIASKTPDRFEAVFCYGQKNQPHQVNVVPIETGRADGMPPVLALFYHPQVSDQSPQDTPRQSDALKERFVERTQVLEEYTRYVDAGEYLITQLRQSNEVPVVLQTLAEQVIKAMNASFTAIYRIDEDWVEYIAGVKSPVLHHRKASLDDGILSEVLRTNQMRFFHRLDQETALHLWRNLPDKTPISSLGIVPLICTGGLRLILYVGYNNPSRFDNNEALVVQSFIEATIDTIQRIQAVKQLERSISARNQEIALLYDLSTYASQSVEPDNLLERSLRRIMKAVPCDTGLIYHMLNNQEPVEMISCWPQTGIPPPIRQFLREEESLPTSFISQPPYLLYDSPAKDAFTCITVQIHNKSKRLMLLRLFADPNVIHHGETIHLIVSASRQLGISIDSVFDRKLAEEVIVLEERQRMARNLHDSITQSLYALALSGDVAQRALDLSEEDRLRSTLEDISSSALQALKEMRLMLYELRPAVVKKAGLIEALELRLNTVERRSGMEATLECTGNAPIPEAIEAEVYHIINEALNNSLRHSGAQAVRVSIHLTNTTLIVEVKDNGKGFDISSIKQGGMGLNSMMERSQKLGGNLSINSSAGQGTCLSLKVRIKGGG